MPDVATNEPLEQRAGITWEWERTLSDFPASSWTLKYWFKKSGSSGANFSIQATASGDKHVVLVAAVTTAAYTAGDYTWVAVATSGAESREADSGTLTLLPRYDAAANLDDRSHARKVLDAIEAVIEGRASKDQEEYTIGTRSLKHTPLADIVKFRGQYKAEVQREVLEEAARNGKGGGRLVVKL